MEFFNNLFGGNPRTRTKATTPEDFKSRVVSSNPNAIANDGTPYSRIDPRFLVDSGLNIAPGAVAKDGTPYTAFKTGYSLPRNQDRTDQERIQRFQAEAAAAQRVSDQANSIGGFAKNFGSALAGNLTLGAKNLGDTLGQSLATPFVAKVTTEANEGRTNTLVDLSKTIREKEARGENADRLKIAYNKLYDSANPEELRDLLPVLNKTNAQVAGEIPGTALDLVAGATGTKAVGAVTNVITKPAGLLTTAGRVAVPATLGYAADVSTGLQGDRGENRDEGAAFIPGLGTAIGTAVPLIGALGRGTVNNVATRNAPEAKLRYVTPTSKEIPEAEFKQLVNQSRISPKTTTEPARYILSPREREVAIKYSDAITKEPVNTAIRLGAKIGELDEQVGTFLRKNNAIYNRGELRNSLSSALADLDDVNVPEERVAKLKDTLISRFVDKVEKNDMEGLWLARKEYDQAIESAFRGSPTLQKEAKVRLRNAVQDFISERTPDGAYKQYMQDMTGLFRLRDIVDIKAAKGRGADSLLQWAKDNPKTARVLGIVGTGLGLGVVTTAGASIVNAGNK